MGVWDISGCSAADSRPTNRYGLHTNVPCETEIGTRAPTPFPILRASHNYPTWPVSTWRTDDAHGTGDTLAPVSFGTAGRSAYSLEPPIAFALSRVRRLISVLSGEDRREPSGLYREADTFPVTS